MKLWMKQTFFITKIKNKMILSKGRGVRLNFFNTNLSEIATSTLFTLCILVLSAKITNYMYYPSQRLLVYQEYHPGLVTEFYLPGQNWVKWSRKTRRVKWPRKTKLISRACRYDMVRHQSEPDWVEPTCLGEMKCKSQFLTRFFVYKTIVSQQNLSKLKSFWASKSIQLEGRSNYKSYFSFLA